MTNFAFRIRLHDPLSDEDADRLFDAFDEEVAVEEGPRGHFVGFERGGAFIPRRRAGRDRGDHRSRH